jgi:alcohol dehydrogenase class IV
MLPSAFSYHSSPVAITFGVGAAQQINTYLPATPHVHAVVLIADPGVIQAGLVEPVHRALTAAGYTSETFSDIRSDPTAASIDAAAEVIRRIAPQLVIALGGGSALDVAKLATVVAGADEGCEAYALMARPLPDRRAHLIALPTTAGTGAEVTRTVVFSNSAGRKVWGWGAQLLPDQAILDPQLTVSLPPTLTAMTGLDVLVHGIEAGTNRSSNPFVQAQAWQAIRLAATSLPLVLAAPDNLAARGDLLIAATLAGLAIDAAGTGLAHAIGHALGTLGHVPHGQAVALAMDAIYIDNAIAAPDLYAQVALAMGVAQSGERPETCARQGANFYRRLIDTSGLPRSLASYGLSIADADRLVAVTQSDENAPIARSNCYQATADDLLRYATELLQHR